MKKLSKIYFGERLAILTNLFKILKKKHLFGKYILSYHSPAETYRDLNSYFIFNSEYVISSDRVRFRTNKSNNSFMKQIKSINIIVKSKHEKTLSKSKIIDVYLEDYFKKNSDELLSRKTYFHYEMVFGIIALMLGFVFFTLLLSFIVSKEILIMFLILFALFIGYVQCKLCVV